MRAYSVEAMAASICDMSDSGVDGKLRIASNGLHPRRPPPPAIAAMRSVSDEEEPRRREVVGLPNEPNPPRDVWRAKS